MNVDPTDPDTFEDGEDGGEDGPGEIALEAPKRTPRSSARTRSDSGRHR